jgi:hypothetical protein
MIKTIYHGSDHTLEKPQYGIGKKYNDYGLGFYCTEDINMAKEWGISQNKPGYANCYSIDCTDLSIIDLNSDQFCILHWITVLLENRNFETTSVLAHQAKMYLLENYRVNYSKYDIITGYRADDSYFSYAQDFINGAISIKQLNKAMHLGKLGTQFVLKSKDAFDRLIYLGSEKAEIDEWYQKKNTRDKNARREYLDLERFRIRPGDIFITQILSEEIKADDPRIRQNLS